MSLLPFIEGQPMYNAWNFSFDFDVPEPGKGDGRTPGGIQHTTVAQARLSIFVCPSDTSGPKFSTSAIIPIRDDIPALPDLATGSYAFCAGTGGPPKHSNDTTGVYFVDDIKHNNNGFADYGTSHPIAEFIDGTSQTLAVGETTYNDGVYQGSNAPGVRGSLFNVWTINQRYCSTFRVTKNPLNTPPGQGFRDGPWLNGAFGSMHPGGGNFLFADGSVHFLKNSINYRVYNFLATRNLNEVISSDQY